MMVLRSYGARDEWEMQTYAELITMHSARCNYKDFPRALPIPLAEGAKPSL